MHQPRFAVLIALAVASCLSLLAPGAWAQSPELVDKALNVGDKAADAELLKADETKVKLSELWQQQPLVLVFYRGGWCPYCNKHLRALEESLSELGDAGARLVAVSPELPEKAQQTTRKLNLSMLVLTDKGNELAHGMGIAFRIPEKVLPMYRDRLGIAQYNGDDSYELPLAAAYVIDTEGVIRYAFLDTDYKKRADPKALVGAVKKLGQAPAEMLR